MGIHKTAIISKKAKIDSSAEIGPGVIIEEDVLIHPGVTIMANAFICKGTEIGEETTVHMGAVIGNAPQDYAYKEEKTFTKIGKRNIIREYATIHRGTKEGTSTVIGDKNFLMVQAHLGHNCVIEDDVVIANSALLGGYVKVETGAFISGNVVLHQFCRVGRYAMIGGFTGVNQDVPPYMLVRGPSTIRGVNLVGIRRLGMSKEAIKEIKAAYTLLFHSDLGQEEALEKIRGSFHSQEIQYLVSFIEQSKRGICKYKNTKSKYFE